MCPSNGVEPDRLEQDHRASEEEKWQNDSKYALRMPK